MFRNCQKLAIKSIRQLVLPKIHPRYYASEDTISETVSAKAAKLIPKEAASSEEKALPKKPEKGEKKKEEIKGTTPQHAPSLESDEDIVLRYTQIFDDCDIDGWWIRKHMTDLAGMDMIPHPLIIQAALRACRRVNDYALCVRFLELVKDHCGPHEEEIWPWILNQIQVVFVELGIESPDTLCYFIPEAFLDDNNQPMFMTPLPPPYGKGGKDPHGPKGPFHTPSKGSGGLPTPESKSAPNCPTVGKKK